MKQLDKRLTAALLALLLLLSTAAPLLAASAEDAGGETLRISTVQDLLALQARCTVDTATQIVNRGNLFSLDSQKALFAFEQQPG